MLRNRRRPHYGAPICAIMAALLLLLSVSVLYSHLGFDRSSSTQVDRSHSLSSSRLGLGFSNLDFSDDIDAITVNPLLEDVENDAITNAATSNAGGGGDEDRIDELDVDSDDQTRVSDEEEILRGVDFEEESESDGFGTSSYDRNNKRSDYVWDHVVGVMRRAFDKRSVEPWQDSSPFGFSSSYSEQDRSKIAFGSDDQPVDENVRHKLDEIRVIEDALLLKSGGSSSSLRDGWSTWFEKKGDFLRRDRMFKSNLENLNPLNNPLLQDPDGIGLTTLTRGDKIIHKALLSNFRKIPFLAMKNPIGIAKEQTSVNGWEDKVEAMKGVERRALDDNGGSTIANGVEDIDSSSKSSSNSIKERVDVTGAKKTEHEFIEQTGKKNLHSVEKTKSELADHLYADGKRWGYFPSLPPHLSFSDFVSEFFNQGKCSLRVFMIWNSPPWMYSVRHQRSLESLLYHHPDACVMVFSETIELDFFNDFVKDGFKVAVAMPNLDELLEDTPTREFATVWFQWRKTNFYPVHYSELIRLAALYKYGGLYLDTDIIVLKPLPSINNFVSVEDQMANGSLSGAAMAFTKQSPFVMECLKEYYSTYDETLLRWNGADLLTRVSKQFSSREIISDKQQELRMRPSSIFFPIARQNITSYFIAPADESERAEQDILFRKILKESFTFHFWNSVTSTLIPHPESLVSRILNHFCIHCLDVL